MTAAARILASRGMGKVMEGTNLEEWGRGLISLSVIAMERGLTPFYYLFAGKIEIINKINYY